MRATTRTKGDWTADELRRVWRALARLPIDDVTAPGVLAEVVRRRDLPAAGADGAHGIDQLGAYEVEGARLVLGDAALGAQVTRWSLDEVVATMIGRGVWRRHRVAAGIDDPIAFGALYARYHLAPESLAAEDYEAFVHLREVLPAAEDPDAARVPDDVAWIDAPTGALDASQVVDEALAATAARALAEASFGPGPWEVDAAAPPLSEVADLAPWRFLVVARAPTAERPVPERWAVGVDPHGLAHGHRGRAGAFGELVSDLRERALLSAVRPEALVAAWHALTRGACPMMSSRPGGARVGRRPDGSWVFVATTIRQTDRRPLAHWITIDPQGLHAVTTIEAPTGGPR